MTEINTTESIEPAAATVVEPKPSRWQRLRPRSRLSTVATAVLAAAASLLVAVAIFATGFALGSGGGEHHGPGGGGGEHSWQADHQNGGGDRHQGHHGQDGEQHG
jgi:hypothetical protein